MRPLRKLKIKFLGEKQDTQNPPKVEWLLQHRQELGQSPATTKGAAPLCSLYRMYEYFVVGFMNGLRTEIEYFFNRKKWIVSGIPDPKDPDPARYAILAVLTQYLVLAFNRLIERGLPRGSPAIITPKIEERLKAQKRVLEREPKWATEVPRVQQTLVIPSSIGKRPEDEHTSLRFLNVNIIAEEPHVLFV